MNLYKQFLVLSGVLLFVGNLRGTTVGSWTIKNSRQQTVSPESIVNQQITAYNKRNIEVFLATYHDSITVQYFPNRLMSKGKAALRENYEPMFQRLKSLEAKITNRIVHGVAVVDHETAIMTSDNRSDTLTVVVVYELNDNLIHRVTFIQ